MVDYRKLRFSNLNSPEFRHLWLLLFWGAFGICFMSLERLIPRTDYHVMWCPLDDRIPFCEWFLIPYLFWFIFLVGMHAYLLLFDTAAFRRFMYYIMITYTVTALVYIFYPTCQNLRPTEFARDNFLVRFMKAFYQFDTNTNVCPSLHVCGSFAAALGLAETERFGRGWRKPLLFLIAWLISISTVFVKQHSILDVVCGLIICLFSWLLVYRNFQKINNTKSCAAKSCVV